MSNGLHSELSYKVIGAAQEVHRVLGPGFLEAVYEESLVHELTLRQIPFDRQVKLEVKYKEICAGEYRPDLIIDGKINVEIKAVPALLPIHLAQALNYLAITNLRISIVLNFGTRSLQVKRVIR